MQEQITLFDICPSLLPQPRWIDCFAQCRHFDSHADFLPDFFPGTKLKRCRYCDHEYGTSVNSSGKRQTDMGQCRCIANTLRGNEMNKLDELAMIGPFECRHIPTGAYTTNRNGCHVEKTKMVEYVRTKSGEYKVDNWLDMAEEAARADRLDGLLAEIREHVTSHCAWLRREDDVRRHALECLVSGAYRHWPGFKQEDGK